MTPPTEVHIIQRYGYTLLTTDNGRTAIASPVLSEIEFRFVICGWYDTYEQALTVLQVAFEDPEHPEHTECADGCGLAVTHDGACLSKPGGCQVCEH